MKKLYLNKISIYQPKANMQTKKEEMLYRRNDEQEEDEEEIWIRYKKSDIKCLFSITLKCENLNLSRRIYCTDKGKKT